MASEAEKHLSGAVSAIFFIAGVSIAVGLIALAGVEFLQRFGAGGYSILSGIVFLVLGFFVRNKRSKVALGIAMGIFALDGIFFIKTLVEQKMASGFGGIAVRGFLLYYMYRGLAAIDELNAGSLSEPLQPVASLPQTIAPMLVSKPQTYPTSISFVAPASGSTFDARPKPIAADFAAAALRHLVYRCEISSSGIRAIYSSGKQKEYAWSDFASIIIRQLPPEPPWNGKILMDLIPAASDAGLAPVRLFTSTYVNYSYLPQGLSPSSQENMRRLGLYVLQQNPRIAIEPWTAQFLHAAKSPLKFANLSQFANYDARYS